MEWAMLLHLWGSELNLPCIVRRVWCMSLFKTHIHTKYFILFTQNNIRIMKLHAMSFEWSEKINFLKRRKRKK
jgi:hypothetical protein